MPWIGERKLIASGDGALVVVLPRSWIRAKKLKKGDKVLVLSDGRVVIEVSNPERIEEAHRTIHNLSQGKNQGADPTHDERKGPARTAKHDEARGCSI